MTQLETTNLVGMESVAESRHFHFAGNPQLCGLRLCRL